jgi:ubiquinone/menaquinone biosynthesis C-methylase UbiE
MSDPPAMSWRDFWEHRNFIYTSERHLAAHYRLAAQDILSLEPTPDAVVLDFGCGDALEAGVVASHVAALYLYDAATTVQLRLKRRFSDNRNIVVLNDAAVAALPPGMMDMIVVNSVLQYVSTHTLREWLADWHRLLKPRGKLVLADVIPPDNSMVADILPLLRFASREGFFTNALVGMIATFFTDYRRLRRELGLTCYSEADMHKQLCTAGFVSQRRYPNFGCNQQRMTFIARLHSSP